MNRTSQSAADDSDGERTGGRRVKGKPKRRAANAIVDWDDRSDGLLPGQTLDDLDEYIIHYHVLGGPDREVSQHGTSRGDALTRFYASFHGEENIPLVTKIAKPEQSSP